MYPVFCCTVEFASSALGALETKYTAILKLKYLVSRPKLSYLLFRYKSLSASAKAVIEIVRLYGISEHGKIKTYYPPASSPIPYLYTVATVDSRRVFKSKSS